MKDKHRCIKLYNLLFPIWLIIFIPSVLWFVLIPANYVIDRTVLYLSLKGHSQRTDICKRNAWRICLAGFLSDFIGSLFLVGCLSSEGEADNAFNRALNAVGYNPFHSIGSFLLVLFAIAIAGFLIYFFDRKILTSYGLDIASARKSALWLAFITAPYLYFIPSHLIW